MILSFRNTSAAPSVNEVDVTTSTLNELVQNMNDIANRELQRQQVNLVICCLLLSIVHWK